MSGATEQSVIESVPKQLLIGGEWRDAGNGEKFAVDDPSTGESLCEIADATADDAKAALDAACAAQEEWAATTNSNEFFGKLFALGQQAGFTRQTFTKCQQDEKLLKKLVAQRDRGEQFGVDKTPTFFINGNKLDVANATIEEFDKALEPLLTR